MVTDIDRDERKRKLDHPKKIVLVDVLPEDQFRQLHLPGAINIPADEARRLAAELEVILYCAGAPVPRLGYGSQRIQRDGMLECS